IVNFRSRLIERLLDRGWAVSVAAPPDDYSSEPILRRCDYRPLPFSRRGTNPLYELATLFRIAQLLKAVRPDIVLTWTPKPNIYAALLSTLLGVEVVPNIAGLGTAFIRQGMLSRAVSLLYYCSLKRCRRVFFQNDDDQRLFVSNGWVSRSAAERLPGSGVDLRRFVPTPLPCRNETVLLFAGRLLADKGLRELIAATRKLKTEGCHLRLLVAGFVDAGNPSGISQEEVGSWQREELIEYLGPIKDICPVIAQADCVVLPSYREGVPRILLEAAAMARPVITTDAIGCRDAVVAGETGFLCRARDADSLAAAMRNVLRLSYDQRADMGRRGRRFVEAHFDEQNVLARYMAVVSAHQSKRELLPQPDIGMP
ncbi:MAG TPA: glycosyltransferase family 4 protein, partial [Nitrococcus sp.]|nr:glycosyltransferase family 4 protein [Nitrococcus sp.]